MSDQTQAIAAGSATLDVPKRAEAARPRSETHAIQLDSKASAALALAVTSARNAGAPPPNSEANSASDRKSSDRPKAAHGGKPLRHKAVAYAATALVALSAGWAGAPALSGMGRTAGERPWVETTQALRQNQDDVARLRGDIASMKAAIDAMSQSADRSRAEAGLRQSQIVERLDRSDTMPAEVAATLARFGEQLTRLEAGAPDSTLKLDALGERLDRIERRMASAADAAATKPVAAAAQSAAPNPATPDLPLQTGSLDTPPAARNTPVDGWVLHEVSDGIALIESRSRRLVEVGPGEMVPGVGRVESIERRGKSWVVVTSKGVIGTVR